MSSYVIHLGTQVKGKTQSVLVWGTTKLGEPSCQCPRAEARVQVECKAFPEQLGLPQDCSSKGQVYPAREVRRASGSGLTLQCLSCLGCG